MAEKSLRQARFFLDQSRDLLGLDKKEMAVIALYNSFFHGARALLFKDGVKERRFIDHLDALRDMRHETQYTVEAIVIEEDLNEISEVCEEFIEVLQHRFFGVEG